MPRRDPGFFVAAVLFAVTLAGAAAAQQAQGSKRGPLDAAPEAGAEPDDDDGELPAGHPPLAASSPHGQTAGAKGMPGVFRPPEDEERPDHELSPGTISVELKDADERPVAHELVTLGILINSVAKGDSRKHVQIPTDDQGRAIFSGLEIASNVAYRVSAGYQGGSFAASPFQLQDAKSMRVVLHVYPVTRDIRQALIVCEATVAAELRDDRVQVEEEATLYNLGRSAWQPENVQIALPEGFTAFSGQTSMSDQGVDESNATAKLRGTFSPGQHAIQFRYQLPWTEDKEFEFDVGLPPHVAIARVLMPAILDAKLTVAGFPPVELRRDARGQTFFVTERRLRPEDPPLTSVSVALHNLPASGPGKIIATLLAAGGVAIGLVFALSGGGPRGARTDAQAMQGALLDDLVELERAHARGEVGPRTYERTRRELVDAVAQTLLKT